MTGVFVLNASTAPAKTGAPALLKGSKLTLIAGKSFWPESDDYRDKWMSSWAKQYGADFGVESVEPCGGERLGERCVREPLHGAFLGFDKDE